MTSTTLKLLSRLLRYGFDRIRKKKYIIFHKIPLVYSINENVFPGLTCFLKSALGSSFLDQGWLIFSTVLFVGQRETREVPRLMTLAFPSAGVKKNGRYITMDMTAVSPL